MNKISIEYYACVISVVLMITCIEMPYMLILLAWLIINAFMIYDLRNKFTRMSEDEILNVTGYTWFENNIINKMI